MDHEWIVVSVGGSLVVPAEIDTTFLLNFKQLIIREIERGNKFAIITGGGRTAREYQAAGDMVSGLLPEDKDWLGIHATRLNAHLLRAIFYQEAHPVVVKNPNKKITTNASLVITAGWKPGRSTDYVAVKVAKQLGAKKIANLSNIDFVYDKDPKISEDAKPITETSWKAFRKIIPKGWDPGLSSPFDPVAAKEAEKMGLEVAIINGKNLSEFEHYLHGEPFQGTMILDKKA